jgi:lantibiotic modifying enzyme
MSTNKVYGDRPNAIRLKKLETRLDDDDASYEHGIPESFSIDQSMHSLFGVAWCLRISWCRNIGGILISLSLVFQSVVRPD